MNKIKVVSIIGARPQFIKVSAIHRAIEKHDNIEHIIIHTSQHYDNELSDIFFKQLGLPEPNHTLSLPDISTSASIQRMMDGITALLPQIDQQMVIVYGDTNSTLAGALSANKLSLPIAHVEAGLRSYDMTMPEERNRIDTDKLSALLFCPTKQAVKNLDDEGFDKESIVLSGDVMFDSILHYQSKALELQHDIKPGKFILASIHRQKTVGSKDILENIIKAFNEIHKEIPIIFPAHPATAQALKDCGQEIQFKMTPAVGYFEMLNLLSNCELVLTDSGGLQKEAYFSKKICITVRENTEWIELVNSGVNILAGTSYESIMDAYRSAKLLEPTFDTAFYGDGKSADVIVDEILKYVDRNRR